MKTYIAGESINWMATVYKSADPFTDRALATPATSHTITVTNPLGATVVSAQAMTASSAGKLYYRIQTSTDTTNNLGVIGEYAVTVNIDDGAAGTSLEKGAFRLEAS